MKYRFVLRSMLLLAAAVALAPIASAQFYDVLDFTNDDININTSTTLGLTELGYSWTAFMPTGGGQRIRIQNNAGGGRIDFATNAAGQTHVGSYAYSSFPATPVANFGSIKIQIDVINAIPNPVLLRFLISSGANWYLSSPKEFAADTTYLFNIDPELSWGQITDAALLTDLEELDGGDNLPMQSPASLTYGPLPANFSLDGGGIYIESNGDNQSRPQLQALGWDTALVLVEVPQVRGMTVTNATAALTTAGFTVANSTATPGDWLIPVGNVQSTSPGAAQNASQGSEVLLNIVANFPNAWLWNGGDGNLFDEARYTAVGVAPPVSPITPTSNDHGLRLRNAGTVHALGVTGTASAIWTEGGSTLHIGQDADVTVRRWLDTGVQQMGTVGHVMVDGNAKLTTTTDTTVGQNNANDLIAATNLGVDGGHGKGEFTIKDTAIHTVTQNLRIGGQNINPYADRLGYGKYTAIGSALTITVGRNFEVNTPTSVLKFVADANGFSTIAQTGTAYSFRPGGTLEIDTTAYTGGADSWDLVTWVGGLNESNITLDAFVATAVLPADWSLSADTTAGASKLTLTYAPVAVVPDVTGLTQVNATAAITSAGLVVGVVTQQSSTTVPQGTVISQSPVGSTTVTQGTAVDLVVSAGESLLPGGPITSNVYPPFIDEGTVVILTAPTGSDYVWRHSGTVIVGMIGQTLVFDPVSLLDAGIYTAEYNDGTKVVRVSAPFNLVVSPEGSVPVAGLLGLAVLAGACGLGGALVIRRSK